jgi:hypothetical protein
MNRGGRFFRRYENLPANAVNPPSFYHAIRRGQKHVTSANEMHHPAIRSRRMAAGRGAEPPLAA